MGGRSGQDVPLYSKTMCHRLQSHTSSAMFWLPLSEVKKPFETQENIILKAQLLTFFFIFECLALELS